MQSPVLLALLLSLACIVVIAAVVADSVAADVAAAGTRGPYGRLHGHTPSLATFWLQPPSINRFARRTHFKMSGRIAFI